MSAFLAEMTSVLPYKRPRYSPVNPLPSKRHQRRCDWESLLSEMHRLMGRFLTEVDRKRCRGVSRVWRRAFSRDVNCLTLRDVTSNQLTAALRRVFTNVTDVKVTALRGRLEADVRHCSQLRRLWIEPVHTAGREARRLATIGALTQLEELHLWGPVGCTAQGVQHLATLTRLTSLSLGTRLVMQGKDWSALGRCTGLRQLQFVGCCSLDDDGLSFLATAFTQLTQLQLSVAWDGTCDVRDEGMSALGSMTTLLDLDLRGLSAMTSHHFGQLMQLTQLTGLKLELAPVGSRVEVAGLERLTDLRRLSLGSFSGIDDQAVQSLSQLTRMTALHLGECVDVTDEGAAAMGALPSLVHLKLDRCPWLTRQGLDALIAAPSLKSLKITGIYSITGDELHDFMHAHHLLYDTLAWKQQILLIRDIP